MKRLKRTRRAADDSPRLSRAGKLTGARALACGGAALAFLLGCAESDYSEPPLRGAAGAGSGGTSGASQGGSAGTGAGAGVAGAAGQGAAAGRGGVAGSSGAAGGTGASGGNSGAGGAGAAGSAGNSNGGSLGTGRYLDRCASGSTCASGSCVPDVGGTSLCSKPCAAHTDCASEQVCGLDGLCHPDDTGALCSTGDATQCELGLCIGLPSGPAHCTRACVNASECPAGFACQPISGLKVCVDIERSGASCPTGLSFPTSGCTALCSSAADCPARLGAFGLQPYTCGAPSIGDPSVCIPPDDVQGSDPIGAACSATGTVSCRSGACNTAAVPSAMCTQACSEAGGCGPGLGCTPEIDGATLTLICARAGSTALGQPCSSGTQCSSGLCDAGGYCTRLCTGDLLCPTDMQCQQVAGYNVALCRR